MTYVQRLIDAQESVPFNSEQNIFNIEIPDYINVCDFSKSGLAISIECLDKTTGNSLGLQDVQFKNGYDLRCLLRNMKLMVGASDQIVEETHNLNVLSMNLKAYKQNQAQQASRSWLGEGESGSNYGTFIQKYNSQSRVSHTNNFQLVPMSDIFGNGKKPQWCNTKFGGTKIQGQLEYTPAILENCFTQVYLPATNINGFAAGNQTSVVLASAINNLTANPWYNGMKITVSKTYTYVTDEATNCSIASPCVITLTNEPEYLQLAVGKTVTIANAAGGGWPGLLNGNHVITAMDNTAKTITIAVDASGEGAQPTTYPDVVLLAAERVADNTTATISSSSVSTANVLTLNVSENVGNPVFATASATIATTGSGVNDDDLTYRINRIQLRSFEVMLNASRNASMQKKFMKTCAQQYASWICEPVNMPVVTAGDSYSGFFDLQRNCKQVIIMMPINGDTDPLKSQLDDMDNYRFSVDGYYTTSRNVVPYHALYYDELNSAFVNMRLPLENYVGAHNRMLWCQMIAVDGARHQIQFTFTQGLADSTANKTLYVYQLVNHNLVVSSGMVRVE